MQKELVLVNVFSRGAAMYCEIHYKVGASTSIKWLAIRVICNYGFLWVFHKLFREGHKCYLLIIIEHSKSLRLLTQL